MKRRYARIGFIKEIGEIHFRFQLLKRAPEPMVDWYIRKSNPYQIEQESLLGEEGYMVKLPFLEKDTVEKREMIEDSLARALINMSDNQVSICRYPEGLTSGRIQSADGRGLMPFFLYPAVVKALKRKGKSLKHAEFVIICGDYDKTMTVLDCLYPHVNYLSVLFTDGDIPSVFFEKAKEMFADTGINLNLAFLNKSILENGDVLLNTAEEDVNWDHYYRRGALFFDLSGNQEKRRLLAGRREDMLLVDGLRIRIGEECFPLPVFELPFYLKCREYRQFKYKGYDPFLVADIARAIKKMDANFTSLLFQDKPLRYTHSALYQPEQS